jgi:hypothetical protein
MITPMYKLGLVLYVETKFARHYVPFLCLGDHGPYCRIEYGAL